MSSKCNGKVLTLSVDVDRSLNVETREDGLHLEDALAVSRPHATEPSGIVGVEISRANLEVGNVEALEQLAKVGVRVAASKAGVTAGAVAVPEGNESVGQRLASCHVQNTNIEGQGNTDLVLGHILAQRLRTRPVVGSGGDIGSQDASVVLENLVVGSLGGDRVGGVGSALHQSGFLATLLPSFLVEVGGAVGASLGKIGMALVDSRAALLVRNGGCGQKTEECK